MSATLTSRSAYSLILLTLDYNWFGALIRNFVRFRYLRSIHLASSSNKQMLLLLSAPDKSLVTCSCPWVIHCKVCYPQPTPPTRFLFRKCIWVTILSSRGPFPSPAALPWLGGCWTPSCLLPTSTRRFSSCCGSWWVRTGSVHLCFTVKTDSIQPYCSATSRSVHLYCTVIVGFVNLYTMIRIGLVELV